MGEQFKFQWWDHVFNKAVDNITVTKDQGDISQDAANQGIQALLELIYILTKYR
ncbi:G patch domain-containing protein 4 [Portunus trituberculatus]|uniref:G patch domain-containing protein 4 n=1 Tax=Portunus trituberculatus TaxID=210409 RepID=A0A5B7FXE8_PORTR|nr:G patch domain-containing protein 4 [Portunus trituberculatus]